MTFEIPAQDNEKKINYNVFATSSDGTEIPVSCDSRSGLGFPVGITTVECEVSDESVTAKKSFIITITRAVLPPPTPCSPGTELIDGSCVITNNPDNDDQIDWNDILPQWIIAIVAVFTVIIAYLTYRNRSKK